MNSFPPTDPTIGRDFQLAWLDDQRAFFRGWRQEPCGDRQAVLAVVSSAEPGFSHRLLHEFQLSVELDPAWAARPLELVSEEGRSVLIFEDRGGEPLDQLLGSPLQLQDFLRFAVGLCHAVGRMHDRGIIHKDIKPANVLINRAGGEVWLTGFGIASRLLRERQAPDHPEFIAGTLAYMAPEQTGRMNRSIDSRSDLYALGVTLYQMLSGVLPFSASDPMELVHCHIARQPVPPNARSKTVPAPVAAIVMKLLAKMPEDRYQTAAGAERDFERCLEAWETRGTIDELPLGEHDVSDRFVIPEKLYGRAREIDALAVAFDRVVQSGTPELVLVSGYAGIGKSSVVNELHKALFLSRGFFALGNFDQYQRDIPCATVAQAFKSIVASLLGKTEADLQSWRDAFCEALGSSGRLIVDLIPELKLIVGEQPPVPELPAHDAQRRFQLVLRRFVGVFARREHPLVLFLDDLQWLDAATIDLLADLLNQETVHHLLLIGAYRDNEVDANHPLMRKLKSIRGGDAKVHEIVIGPLDRCDLERLIVETVHCPPDQAGPLAQLLDEKTGGNPFFVIQFLTNLAHEELLTFDRSTARWTWDITRIQERAFTDNIVELMLGKLARLTVAAQNAMTHLACLGHSATIETLSMVLGIPNAEITIVLAEPIHTGLLVRSQDGFAFLHDRVKEAAYARLPPSDRAAAHLRIGRLLTKNTPANKIDESIFDIVNHLNRGAALITSTEERDRVAELNLVAGKRAQAAAAFAWARIYFEAGSSILSEGAWEQRYPLAFELELHRGETEFLAGDSQSAETRLASLALRAGNPADRAAVACQRIDLTMTLGRSDRAVEIGLEYFHSIGIHWSAHPTDEEVREEYEEIRRRLANRPIEELIDLAPMTDPEWGAVMAVLTKILPPALFTDQNLQCLVVCRMTNISLAHGNSDGSCLGYVWLGGIMGPRFGDYRQGFRFGKLSIDLVEQRGLKRFMARVYLGFGSLVTSWTKPLRTAIPAMRRALEAAQETGDLAYATFAYYDILGQLLAGGAPLDEVQREADGALGFVTRLRFGLLVDSITGQLRLIRTLRGLTPTFGVLNDGDFDEGAFERHLETDSRLANANCRYWVKKLQARVYAHHSQSIEAVERASLLLWALPPTIEIVDYHFYAALALAEHFDKASRRDRIRHLRRLVACHKQLKLWARNCPENFADRAALIAGEIARIRGNDFAAMTLYEDAINLARKHEFVQNEGIANETAGKFYGDRGFAAIALTYLRSARRCYSKWGALGKVKQLEQLYPQLQEEGMPAGPRSTIAATVDQLDIATVLKVSQAVSGEMMPEKLIDSLMRTAIEHAGAERGLMLLSRGNEQRVEAEVTTSGDRVVVHLRDSPLAEAALPESVIQYAVRTGECVIVGDALAQNQFSSDPYIAQHRPRSILCLPLANQAKLVGSLYLENNLTPHVFTPAATAVLRLLASQAAISLENARLYADLVVENAERQKAEEERRQAEEALQRMQTELAAASRLATIGELAGSIVHEINQPLGAILQNAFAAVSWLSRESPELVEARGAIADIEQDVQRVAEVIKGLKNLARKSGLQLTTLDMGRAIREVLALMHGELRRGNIVVQLDPAGLDRSVVGDRVQLHQVLVNLIRNATEAMSGIGGRPRTLKIFAQRVETGRLEIAVADAGTGLRAGTANQIFDPLFTTKPDGMGMGLAICRSIVAAHQGRLWATPNHPYGTIFRFTLPMATGSSAAFVPAQRTVSALSA